MASNRIRIQLRGDKVDNELIRLSDLSSELDALYKVLRNIDRTVSKSQASSMYFRVTDLSISSPTNVECEAVPKRGTEDYTKAAVGTFFIGLDSIQRGKTPEGFERDTIVAFKELGAVLKRNISEIRYSDGDSSIRLRADFHAQVNEILAREETVQGSVSGLLEFINIHAGTNKFRIYPIAGPQRLDCHFPKSLLEKAISGVGRNVSVKGEVKYQAGQPLPHAVDVEEIEVFPDESELPGLFDICGIAPDATGELMSEEFVRRIRDAG